MTAEGTASGPGFRGGGASTGPVTLATYFPTAAQFDEPPADGDLQIGPQAPAGRRLAGSAMIAVPLTAAFAGLASAALRLVEDAGTAVVPGAVGLAGVAGTFLAFRLAATGRVPMSAPWTFLGTGALGLILGLLAPALVSPASALVTGLGAVTFLLGLATARAEALQRRRVRAWTSAYPRLVADPHHVAGTVRTLTLTNVGPKQFTIRGEVAYPGPDGVERVVPITAGTVPRQPGVEPPVLGGPVCVWHSGDHSMVLLRFAPDLTWDASGTTPHRCPRPA